jgi:hypothetical protein
MSDYSSFIKFARAELLDIFDIDESNCTSSICVVKNSEPYSIFDNFSIFLVEWTQNESVRLTKELGQAERRSVATQFAYAQLAIARTKLTAK